MNPNLPVLPDSIFNALVVLGILAVAVYIASTGKRENAVREIQTAVEKNKTSQTLAEHYMAAADGDPDDRNYWEETAKQFEGGAEA